MQTIVVASKKGGCGKTTASVSLAVGLARRGFRTVIADLDSQCNASTSFGIKPEELKDHGKLTLADAFIAAKPASQIQVDFGERFNGNLKLLPGHRALDQVEFLIESEINSSGITDGLSPFAKDERRAAARLRFKRSVASIADQTDFLICDTPPKVGFELTAALLAADWFLIPVFPSAYDVDGLQAIITEANNVRTKGGNAKLHLLGVLLGSYKANTNLHQDVRQKLLEMFGNKFFATVISDSVRHEEATFRKESIYEYATVQRDAKDAARQFEALTDEVLTRVNVQTQRTAPSPPRQVLEVTAGPLPITNATELMMETASNE